MRRIQQGNYVDRVPENVRKLCVPIRIEAGIVRLVLVTRKRSRIQPFQFIMCSTKMKSPEGVYRTIDADTCKWAFHTRI